MTTTPYTTKPRPYRSSVVAGNLIFLSGRLGMREGTLPDTVAEQTVQALRNVEAELAGHSLTLSDIVKVTVFVDDMADYDTVNAAYLSVMPEPLPARTCIAVHALPYGGLVEIEAVAAHPTMP